MTSKDELTANAGKVWPSVGMKCICVREAKHPVTLAHPHPKKGGIYTVRKVVTESRTGVRAILLEEIVLTEWSIPSQLEPGYNLNGFRPIVNKSLEDDVNMFKESLLSIGNEELAADKQRVDYLLDALELAWAAYPGEGE